MNNDAVFKNKTIFYWGLSLGIPTCIRCYALPLTYLGFIQIYYSERIVNLFCKNIFKEQYNYIAIRPQVLALIISKTSWLHSQGQDGCAVISFDLLHGPWPECVRVCVCARLRSCMGVCVSLSVYNIWMSVWLYIYYCLSAWILPLLHVRMSLCRRVWIPICLYLMPGPSVYLGASGSLSACRYVDP